jgi:integrase/recombinase XerD
MSQRGGPLLSDLGPIIAQYIRLKQALGRHYATERDVLAHLDRFLAAQGKGAELSAKTFAQWCATIGHLSSGVRRSWMRIARNLCLYRQRTEPACFVPDPSGFPAPHQPRRPHLFTEEQILRLLRATDDLRPHSNSPLFREVFRLAVVLLYTAGLRRGELVRLALSDYDPIERTLRIRATKFHKSRLVPLSCDAAREMEDYLDARRRLPHAADAPLLCNRSRGLRPYTGEGLGQRLRQLFRCAGLQATSGELPHVHDLRHTFAHEALLRWYRAGVDMQSKLPALATYMGHVSIVSTEHYLALFEPFALEASARFARHCEPFLAMAPRGEGR